MHQIVLLSGKQGSGKTTLQKELAELIYHRQKIGVTFVNFADILYQMHDAVLEVLHQYWPKRDLIKDGPLLQMLGTDWGRKTIDQDIWVKCLKNKIDKMNRSSDRTITIVGDCRFENEFQAFPGALRIRLLAQEDVRKARCSMWRDNTKHPSETGLDKHSDDGKFDLYIDTGSIDIKGAASLAYVALEKNNWTERRE